MPDAHLTAGPVGDDVIIFAPLEGTENFVRCGALRGNPAYPANVGSKFLRSNVLAKGGSGSFGDVFLHQRSAEIVGAGLQAGEGSLDSQLYPGDLHIANCAVQKHPRKGVNAPVLVARCSGTNSVNPVVRF